MNARWRKRSATIDILQVQGLHGHIEVRPKLGVFDVMRESQYGWQTFPSRVHRTNDLFEAIGALLRVNGITNART